MRMTCFVFGALSLLVSLGFFVLSLVEAAYGDVSSRPATVGVSSFRAVQEAAPSEDFELFTKLSSLNAVAQTAGIAGVAWMVGGLVFTAPGKRQAGPAHPPQGPAPQRWQPTPPQGQYGAQPPQQQPNPQTGPTPQQSQHPQGTPPQQQTGPNPQQFGGQA
ncbi:hypothetical protein [Actinokineospora pegani]|uniref:hypothetical protein n=1 Tax=Actinokineospora pegani TaxID=2654637 RepID=UPI0012EA5360|nr:hypothetical protein [Actinokineospora pegani]